MKLIDITESFIKQFAESQIYSRGYSYYRNGNVKNIEYNQDTDTIFAMVHGNYGDYDVEITSEKNNIDASCTCPYDGYPCKHIVAVLLTFLNNRDKYIKEAKQQSKEASSLKSKVEKLSQSELVEMVMQCVKKYPDFRRELMIRFESNQKGTLDAILKQINKAFPDIDSRSYSISAITKQLKSILKSADSASVDVKVEIYWAVASRVLKELNDYGIEEESLEDIVIDALDVIVDSLKDNDSLIELKQKIIGKLIDYYFEGNCGIIDSIYDSAESLCSNKSDYQIIIDKLKSKSKGSLDSYYQDLLADLYEKIGDEDSQLKTLESKLVYGMDYWHLAEYWIKKGNKDKALEVVQIGIQKGKGRKTELYEYLQKYYLKRKDYKEIYKLLEWKVENNDLDTQNIKMDSAYQILKQHYQIQNDYQGQVKLLELQLMKKEIDLDFYKEAERVLSNEDWVSFEEKILTELKKDIKKQERGSLGWWIEPTSSDVLAEIYSYKNDTTNLFDIVKDNIRLLVKYEDKLMGVYPEVYLKNYSVQIDKLIQNRGRDNYISARNYAKVIKKIYQTILKQPDEWEKYISRIRNENRMLKALQEEFRGL